MLLLKHRSLIAQFFLIRLILFRYNSRNSRSFNTSKKRCLASLTNRKKFTWFFIGLYSWFWLGNTSICFRSSRRIFSYNFIIPPLSRFPVTLTLFSSKFVVIFKFLIQFGYFLWRIVSTEIWAQFQKLVKICQLLSNNQSLSSSFLDLRFRDRRKKLIICDFPAPESDRSFVSVSSWIFTLDTIRNSLSKESK